MAQESSGHGGAKRKQPKATKKKGGTATTQKHRFQSFTDRVSKLNIDAVRRQQSRQNATDEDVSNFRSSLEQWNDRNMSEGFTNFARRVDPLSQNLPQILHHEQEICEIFHEFLRKGDTLSLEPLLILVAQFAHDLGPRFEKHFQPTVQIVSSLAATHTDVAVIEWSFTCLAWLFKYLSRLLVPDLRPLFDLMAPLLGRQHQKEFVTRFAAEAMSFLVRKASLCYSKNPEYLEKIVLHAFKDLSTTKPERLTQYQQGLATLFSEAIKGVQDGVTSGAPAIVAVLIRHLLHQSAADEGFTSMQTVVEGIIVDVIHHTSAEGFETVLSTYFECSDGILPQSRASLTSLQLLYVLIGTRKGSRVNNWTPVMSRIARQVDCIANAVEKPPPQLVMSTLSLSSLAIQYGPFGQTLSFSQNILPKLANPVWHNYFLGFCTLCADLGRDRFESLILPAFQRFILTNWETQQAQLCFVLPKLLRDGEWSKMPIKLNSKWTALLIDAFSDLAQGQGPSLQQVHLLDSYLDLFNISIEHEASKQRLASILGDVLLLQSKDDGDTLNATLDKFLLSRGFEFFSQHCTTTQITPSMWRKIIASSSRHARRPAFIRGVITMLAKYDHENLIDEDLDWTVLLQQLVENVASPSHELRLLSLDALVSFYGARKMSLPTSLTMVRDLEALKFDHDSLRSAALSIRQIAANFSTTPADDLIIRVIPAYYFGLLHVALTPLWDEACKSFKDLLSVPGVEDAVVERAVIWLKSLPEDQDEDPEERSRYVLQDEPMHILPGFECSNLSRFDEMVIQSFSELERTNSLLDERFKHNTAALPVSSTVNRAQALRLLRHMPQLAEKRSRFVVPVLLEWGLGDASQLWEKEHTADGDILDKIAWSRQDQKSLLSLFADFVNPSVLYRSDEVYKALLSLLCNGDADIQRSALKALFTWKAHFTKPYETNLLNILDDTRFREEITIFLDAEESSVIRAEDRDGLMPILIRLLYGRVVTRAGLGGSRGSQEARRKAVFLSISRLGKQAIDEFVSIALGPFEYPDNKGQVHGNRQQLRQLPPRKQLGMLRMMRDMLDTLSDQMRPSTDRLVAATMQSLLEASDALTTPSEAASETSLWRSVRHEGLSCLNLLFSTCASPNWIDSIRLPLFERVINPRLTDLPIETAQAPSILIKLFSTWASSPVTVDLLWRPNMSLLETVAACLIVPSAKDELRTYVLNQIIKQTTDRAKEHQGMSQHLKNGTANLFVDRVEELLRQQPTRECLEVCVRTIIELQPFVTGLAGTKSLLNTAIGLLLEPSRRVNPRLKGEVLTLLERFLPLFDFSGQAEFHDKAMDSISKLFSFFQDIPNRQRLVQVFEVLAGQDPSLLAVAKICRLLNAHSSSRLGEPDFELRASAFSKINDDFSDVVDGKMWTPLIHNLLFFIQDEDELYTRSTASQILQHFCGMTASTSETAERLGGLIDRVLLPAIQKGMKKPSELVRSEYVSIIASLVKADWYSVKDLKVLLGSDEESSFFNNILHLQPHRRVRALRRLSSASSSLSAASAHLICLPLIENFCYNTEEASQNLAIEAINTLESLAQALDWPRYRAILQRAMQDNATFSAKLRIRALGAIVNGLYLSHCERTKNSMRASNTDQDVGKDSNLLKTLPRSETISKSLTDSVLAKILQQIHFQDETSIDVRVMLATVAVKIILMLPEPEIDIKLPSVLIDVCNILKSRAQDARDSARKTLSDISSIIGPRYFSFVLKQLRTALKRGYQLHVLSFTTHSLLITLQPNVDHGALDYCLPELVGIVMDDTFGVVGQEKEAQGYLNSMKEFKNKAVGYDTMELLATMTTLPNVSRLLAPIQTQLEKPKPRLEKVDELLRRVREGLRRNSACSNRDCLVLCYEVLAEAKNLADPGEDRATLRYSKMTAFAFELMRRLLDKHEDLKTALNLEGFVPFLTSAMKRDDEEVQMACMRLLSSIIKVPLSNLDDQSGVYVRQAKRLIESSTSTNDANAQAALRLISAILRERPAAVMKKSQFETDMAFLLTKIRPDLEEPASGGERDRQVAAFNFLKALMARGVIVKEMYEIMDTVREMMIKSQTSPIPDLARGVYSRFVLDYFPEEGKGLSKQLEFLTMNLQYEHERGRQSVMEVMMFVLNKMSNDAVQPVLVTVFLPLALVLIVDESEACRKTALALMHKLFERADKERSVSFKSQMTRWLEPDADQLWKTAAFQVWKEYLEIQSDADDEPALVFEAAQRAVENYVEDMDAGGLNLLHSTLDVWHTLSTKFPSTAFGLETMGSWTSIITLLERKNLKIRTLAALLTSVFLTEFSAETSKIDEAKKLPLIGSHGLTLTSEIVEQIVDSGMSVLQSPTAACNAELVSLVTQILSFVASLKDSEEHLSRMLGHLSAALRRELSTSTPAYTKVAALTLLETLLKSLPGHVFNEHAQSILLPLYHITSTAAASSAAPASTHPDYATVHADVVSKAQEAMSATQARLGSEAYIREMQRVQKAVRERREERRGKRAIEAVAAPEKFEKDRKRRMLAKREGRKRKGEIAAGGRRGW